MGKLVGKKVLPYALLGASILDCKVLKEVNRVVAKVRIVRALLLVDVGETGCARPFHWLFIIAGRRRGSGL